MDAELASKQAVWEALSRTTLSQQVTTSHKLGEPTAEFCRSMIKMAKSFVSRPNFRGYSFKEDMEYEVVLALLKYWPKIPSGSTSAMIVSYFLNVSNAACMAYINREATR